MKKHKVTKYHIFFRIRTDEYVDIQHKLFYRKIFLSKVKDFMPTIQEITDIPIVTYTTSLIPTYQKLSLLKISGN